MVIDSKAKMYELLIAGRLGNALRQWRSPDSMIESGYRGLFGLRNATTASKPIGVFRAKTDDLEEVLVGMRAKGYDPNTDFIYCEVPPDEFRIVQGELCTMYSGLYFHCTFLQEYMREALKKESQHLYGSVARATLHAYCREETVEELNWLLEEYTGHVIEFTAFTRRTGLFMRPHVIWEVRNY